MSKRQDVCVNIVNVSPGESRPAAIPLGLEPEQGDVMAVGALGLELLVDPVFINLGNTMD